MEYNGFCLNIRHELAIATVLQFFVAGLALASIIYFFVKAISKMSEMGVLGFYHWRSENRWRSIKFIGFEVFQILLFNFSIIFSCYIWKNYAECKKAQATGRYIVCISKGARYVVEDVVFDGEKKSLYATSKNFFYAGDFVYALMSINRPNENEI